MRNPKFTIIDERSLWSVYKHFLSHEDYDRLIHLMLLNSPQGLSSLIINVIENSFDNFYNPIKYINMGLGDGDIVNAKFSLLKPCIDSIQKEDSISLIKMTDSNLTDMYTYSPNVECMRNYNIVEIDDVMFLISVVRLFVTMFIFSPIDEESLDGTLVYLNYFNRSLTVLSC